MEESREQGNPYLTFLRQTDHLEEAGIMTGLESWLGFAGSSTGLAMKKSTKVNPWEVHRKDRATLDDKLQKKTQATMKKIAGEFCSWIRNLPGDDQTVNETHDETICTMFNTAVNTNPGTSIIGEGLKAWAKYGSTVTKMTGTDIKDQIDVNQQSKGNLNNKDDVERLFGRSVQLRTKQSWNSNKKFKIPQRLHYGAWYLHPTLWNKHYLRHKEKRNRLKTKSQFTRQVNVAEIDVDMMGLQQPVCSLVSSVGFNKYLTENMKNGIPTFLKEIFHDK